MHVPTCLQQANILPRPVPANKIKHLPRHHECKVSTQAGQHSIIVRPKTQFCGAQGLARGPPGLELFRVLSSHLSLRLHHSTQHPAACIKLYRNLFYYQKELSVTLNMALRAMSLELWQPLSWLCGRKVRPKSRLSRSPEQLRSLPTPRCFNPCSPSIFHPRAYTCMSLLRLRSLASMPAAHALSFCLSQYIIAQQLPGENLIPWNYKISRHWSNFHNSSSAI